MNEDAIFDLMVPIWVPVMVQAVGVGSVVTKANHAIDNCAGCYRWAIVGTVGEGQSCTSRGSLSNTWFVADADLNNNTLTRSYSV